MARRASRNSSKISSQNIAFSISSVKTFRHHGERCPGRLQSVICARAPILQHVTRN